MKTSVHFELDEKATDIESLSIWMALSWQKTLHPAAHAYPLATNEYAVELSQEHPVWLRLKRLGESSIEIACLLDPHSFSQHEHKDSKATMLARVVDELSVLLSARTDLDEVTWQETSV